MLKLCFGASLASVIAAVPAAHRGMAPEMMQDGSVSNDGSDYSRVGSKEHVWFERVPDDADAPGTATGYWLNDALKGPDNPACLDGSAPLYYHQPGSGSGKDKWYIHHEVGEKGAFGPKERCLCVLKLRARAQGGGWCYNLADCAGRAKGALGSTNPAVSKDGKTSNLGGG